MGVFDRVFKFCAKKIKQAGFGKDRMMIPQGKTITNQTTKSVLLNEKKGYQKPKNQVRKLMNRFDKK